MCISYRSLILCNWGAGQAVSVRLLYPCLISSLKFTSRPWRRGDGGDVREQRQQDHTKCCAHPHNSGLECKSALAASNLDDVGSAGEAGALHHRAKRTASGPGFRDTEGESRGGAAEVAQAHQEISNSKP